jgi:hypothetical protein
VGKVVAEKLLRSCPSVERIVLLVRPKKKVTPALRFEELLKSTVFDHMRTIRPNDFVEYAHSKFALVSGEQLFIVLMLYFRNVGLEAHNIE